MEKIEQIPIFDRAAATRVAAAVLDEQRRRILFTMFEDAGIVAALGRQYVEGRVATMTPREVDLKIARLRDGGHPSRASAMARGMSVDAWRTVELLSARLQLVGGGVDETELAADPLGVLLRDHRIVVRRDGACEFSAITPEVWELLEDIPVVLFHYTSSSIWDSVKERGLTPGFASPWGPGRGRPHVCLTSETGGALVEVYEELAVRSLGGSPVRLDVETTLSRLLPDETLPQTGKGHEATHFCIPDVRPVSIVNFR